MSTQAPSPVVATFASEHLTIGAGVAIFHLATARVVVCYQPDRDYYFLPKGRKNTNEDVRVAAEREGFEESGYRNRLLPLPHLHRQTDPADGPAQYSTEAICIQLRDTQRGQYLLHWYAAETLPPAEEVAYSDDKKYRPPTPYPQSLSIEARVKLDQDYTPVCHEIGLDPWEATYESYLMTIDEACSKLGQPTMIEVVQRAWKAIEQRKLTEQARESLIS